MAETTKKVIEIDIDVDSSEVKKFDKELVKTEKTLKKTNKETNKFSDRVLKVGDAIKGLGIGLALGALKKLGEAFQKNQKIADATEQSFTAIEIAFNNLTSSIVDAVPKQKRSWSEVTSSVLKFAGPFGELASIFFKNNKASQEYVDSLQTVSEKIVQNRKALQLLEVSQRKFQLLNQNDAEIQRQIRDDYTLTFEERLKANNTLAKILDDSIKKEQELTLKRIENLNFEQEKLGYSFNREIEIKNLKVELLDIEERITGVKSEQQAAERSLYAEQKAAREQANRDAKEALEASEQEFQDWWDELNQIAEREAEKDYDKRMERLHRELDAIQDQQEQQLEARNEYFKELEDLDDYNYEKTLSDQELEIRAVQDQYFKLIELAEIYGADKGYLEEQQAKEIFEINKRYEEETAAAKKAAVEEAAKATVDVTKAGIDTAMQLNDALVANQLISAKKGFQISKALSIASATINTAEASIAAFKSVVGIPYVGPVLAPIAAGVAVAAGVAQIGMIASQKFNPSGGGGGGGAVPTAPSGGGRSPNFNTVGGSQTNQLANSIAGQNQKPVKAYVVSTDMTNEQQLDRKAKTKSSFG